MKNTKSNDSLLEILKQKVQQKDKEIEELYHMLEERDREISQLRSQLKGQGQGNNHVGGKSENMDTTVNTDNYKPNINPASSYNNKGEANEHRQEVVSGYS